MSAMAASLNTRLPPQETFYNDATPVDNQHVSDIPNEDNDEHEPRDSHDLSLHADARTSVVDNMLLSLDQFSIEPTTLYSDFFSPDHSYQASRPTHHRGHTYASSISSDYEPHGDETSSRYSGRQSRGRRSNSSNNIPPAMSRKSSLRTYTSIRDKQLNTMYSDMQQTRHTRSGGQKSSKGSTSSSMDYGYAGILGTHRFGFGRRSASFDHGHIAERSNTMTGKESILDRSRAGYHTYGDYEAAPEPTIPAGPRRVQEIPQSPVFSPSQPTFVPPQSSAPRRRNSIRSTASRTLRKNKSQPAPNMRFQAQEFVNASNFPDLPIRPAYQEPPAPSPTVATRKQALPAPSTPVATPKEKQGFFRRVFGGSSKNQAQVSNTNYSNKTHTDASPASIHHRGMDPQSKYTQPRPQTTPNGSHHIASQLKALPRLPQTATSTQKEAAPPSLAKKHSSFFRRRKKSTSENNKPLPIMALDFRPPAQELIPPSAPSPGISSLRQVMNPYLGDVGSPNAKFYDPMNDQIGAETIAGDVEQPHSFSPGYKPHADATVRTVKPGSRGTDETPPSSRGEHMKGTDVLSSGSPRLKLKMKTRRSTLIDAQDASFLADSSSCNEDPSGRGTPSGERRSSRTVPPSPSFEDLPRESKSAEERHKARMSAHPAPSHSTTDLEDEDGWVLTPAVADGTTATRKSPGRGQRVWLEPTPSEERLDLTLSLPMEGTRKEKEREASAETPDATSPQDVFHSATSLPLVQVESRESEPDAVPPTIERHPVHDEDPTEADRERARRLFNNEDASVQKSQVATVLGDVTATSVRIRKAYMELFDWAGFNILAAMRDLCGKLVLKAETQQVDRILMSLSERWCECNPNHGFKAIDVVHTICYSILLLNTDLHVADIESRMTRNQFVKNTLPTVVRVCEEAIKDGGDETLRPQSAMARRGSIPWNRSEPNSPAADNTTFSADVTDESLENRKARNRLSIRPPARTASEGVSGDSATPESNTLVNNPYNGPMKGWEYQIETVLKEFYNSIRHQRLPLHGASTLRVHEQPSSNNLSVSGMLRRTPSVLSKAPSENLSYRGRSQGEFRSVGNRWASKTRSRPRLYPASTVASSRTSLEDGSVWSPAGSSTWSRYSIGKTGTSMMSMESLGSHFAHGDYQQAIGFANALSQAIIREEGMTMEGSEDFTRVAPLLEDETLELAGAPWAKEGILKHKHHLEALDKKAKDRTWNECFAVIEKGYMRLFSFSMNSKSMRMKNKSRPSAGSVVGGGNWMDNAEALDCFLLRQSIASALPPPGYSKNRPHVWALSLPTGAVHLFQVGTPDIVREFVSTANYWSARLSKEPLVGGVSNIEYGWGETVVNPALIRNDSTPSAHQGHVPRPSMASSLRSSVDHATGAIKPRLPGDKVVLADWTPPAQSMMASNLMEVDQLRALTDYVKNVEDELARHNELRAPMLIAFSPRHPNAAKAMSNWERKSSYLLREIVKFRTYIDSLTAAQNQKAKIYAQREAEKAQNGELNGEPSGAEVSTTAEVDGANKAPASEP